MFQRILAAVVLCLVTAAFLGVPFTEGACKVQAFALLVAYPVWGVVALAALTLVFGRLYCKAICPLGVAMTLVNWICRRKKHVRRVCSRLPMDKRSLRWRWGVVAALALAALMLCPAVTMGMWVFVDVMCIYALLAAPRLRLPAGMVLFATAGCSCYPALGETLLPVIWGFVLCLLALCMMLDVIGGEERSLEHE
jgi:polyferredoxin